MSLLDAILNAQGGGVVQQFGRQFGLGTDQATSALSALVPAIAAGVHQNAQTSDGMAALLVALSGGDHQKYVSDPSALADLAATDDGNGILGHVFGSKLVMGAMAQHHTNAPALGGGSGLLGMLGATLGTGSQLGSGSSLAGMLGGLFGR